VSDETLSKNDLPVNSSTETQDISTRLITYWLIMVTQFDCLYARDLNLWSSHEPKLKRLAHENITAGMHLQKLLRVTNELV